MRRYILVLLVFVPVFLFADKPQKKEKAPKAAKTEKPSKESKKCSNENFTGKTRLAAKTTFSTKKVESFPDLTAFLRSLPEDKIMNERNPPISQADYFQRVEEEDRNVRIDEAWVFAVSRQEDNDYLLVLGSDPDYMKAKFFNAEVTGLPESSKETYNMFNDLRTKVKTQFGNVCGKPMLFMNKPVKVSVAGSLLFDAEGKPGKDDPKKMKSATSWEIHPVAEIEFQ
jgi:hypothetical protein